MTAEEWVRQNLAPLLTPDDAVHLDDGQRNVMEIPAADFVTIFGTSIEAALATDPPGDMYAALSGSQTFVWDGEQLTMTAADMQYQTFFDVWHASGLI